MRIWCGVDVEHNPGNGKMTLFVESDNPNIDTILDVLRSSNYGVSYVYFGAGEVDIKNWKFLDRLSEISDMFIVGIESSIPLSEEIIKKFDYVIFRFPISCVLDNVYIKYRTPDIVGITSVLNFETNRLDNLSNGQYENDLELYNGGQI